MTPTKTSATRPIDPPRSRDEIGSAASPRALIELIWSDFSSSGTIWAIDGSTVCFGLPLDSEYPGAGSCATAVVRVGSETVEIKTVVRAISEVHGCTRLITCETDTGGSSYAASQQRRGNTRFKPGWLLPAFCFGYDIVDRRILPFSVTDISNGGVGLSSRRNPALLPGVTLPCRFEVPAIGSFNTIIRIHHVTVDQRDDVPTYRVSAEFESLSKGAREIVASCLVRPEAPNQLSDLEREKLVPRNWLKMIEPSASRATIAQSGDRDKSLVTHLSIVGHLGDTRVCSCSLSVDSDHRASIQSVYLHPRLDRTKLRDWICREAITHAERLGTNRNGLRAVRHELQTSTRQPPNPSAGASSSESAQTNGSMTARPRQSSPTRGTVSWHEYAEAYDTMCSANPAYQDNLRRFRNWLDQLQLESDATVCDVGAGTGNYVLEIVRRFPTARVVHLDSDPAMNREASKKYRKNGARNVAFHTQDALSAQVEPSSFNIIICVNALYTFADAKTALEECYSWLKPGGQMFLIDLGRPMKVWSWSRYILGSNLRTHGLRATVTAFLRGRKAIGQNRLIRNQQELGNYWLHSTDAFKTALLAAGFKISTIEHCYRGVCDLAICSKPFLA